MEHINLPGLFWQMLLLLLLVNKQENGQGTGLVGAAQERQRWHDRWCAIVALSHKYVMCSDSGLGEYVLCTSPQLVCNESSLFTQKLCYLLHFFTAVCISSTCSENMSLNRTCCCITQLVAASYQLKVTSCNNCAHATDSNLAICWGKTCGNMNLIYIKVMWTLGRIEYAEFA